MNVKELKSFAELKSACLRLYPNLDNLEAVPTNADKYILKIYDTRAELLESIKEASLKNYSYIVLSGKLTPYSTDESPCVMLLGNITRDLSCIEIGGCY